MSINLINRKKLSDFSSQVLMSIQISRSVKYNVTSINVKSTALTQMSLYENNTMNCEISFSFRRIESKLRVVQSSSFVGFNFISSLF